ncbi:MAG: DNA (cytosine-5-)-methyltransferase [Bacteroidota bacterium]
MKTPIRAASLFSGIGGVDIAAESLGWKNVFMAETNPFCRKILQGRFPQAKLMGDVKTEDFTAYSGTIDVLSAGFPCQPFSTAGRRKGKADDRYLWPAVLRVLRDIKPVVFLGENVSGLKSMASEPPSQNSIWAKVESITNLGGAYRSFFHRQRQFGVLNEILENLEKTGYKVQTFSIPAGGVQAPHRRNRIFIVAYHAQWAERRPLRKQETRQASGLRESTIASPNSNTNGNRERQENDQWKEHRRKRKGIRTTAQSVGGNVADAHIKRSQRRELFRSSQQKKQPSESHGSIAEFDKEVWGESWLEAAYKFCGMDDGLPDWMDHADRRKIRKLIRMFGRGPVERRTGLDLSGVDAWRTEALKALGNAIVPQQVLPLLEAIETCFFK